MMSAHRYAAVFLMVLASCGGNTDTPNATSPDVAVDTQTPDITTPDVIRPDVTVDVPRDTVDSGVMPMFSPCTSRLRCEGGAQSLCIGTGEGYPGGLCTRSCSSDAQCGDLGVCIPFGTGMRCFPRCDNASDCRAGYNCFALGGTRPPEDRVCFPFCDNDAQCMPAACNTWSRFCGTVNLMSADNGEPCEQNSNCRSGRCTEELNADGAPTGNLGGICTSRCNVASDAEYLGRTIPQSDCPMGSVCPRDTGAMARSPATCRKECRVNEDCRPGFICSRPRRPGSDTTYDNGYCVAMNCRFMTQMCPPFASCRTTASNDAGVAISGICERTGPDPDGSTSTDAVVIDATSTDATTGDAGASDVRTPDAGATDATAG
jgi:hypothetical protein